MVTCSIQLQCKGSAGNNNPSVLIEAHLLNRLCVLLHTIVLLASLLRSQCLLTHQAMPRSYASQWTLARLLQTWKLEATNRLVCRQEGCLNLP